MQKQQTYETTTKDAATTTTTKAGATTNNNNKKEEKEQQQDSQVSLIGAFEACDLQIVEFQAFGRPQTKANLISQDIL